MQSVQRKMLVAGNWKMNGNLQLAKDMLETFEQPMANTDIVICPPFPFLASFSEASFQLGAQNVATTENGAHTGEVSASILSDFSCQYVIVGHSERRDEQAETNEQIADKVQLCVKQGLTPILCIGESEQVRDSGQLFEFLASQLDAVIKSAGVEVLKHSIVAYEPIWAIGTGKTATPEQAQEVHAFIRQHIAKADADIAAQLRILYGGSVNAGNAQVLFSQPDVDGGLVGGASLKPEDFLIICQAANQQR